LRNKVSVRVEEAFETTNAVFRRFLVMERLYGANDCIWINAGDGVESDIETGRWLSF
jgi:hypothetical protein